MSATRKAGRRAWSLVACLAWAAGFGGMLQATEEVGVPQRAEISQKLTVNTEEITAYADTFIAAKAKLAEVEFKKARKDLLQELRKEEDQRKEYERRMRRYAQTHGYAAAGTTLDEAEDESIVRVRVEVLMPEIALYQAVAAACRNRGRLCRKLAEDMPKLDENGDGTIAEEEYLNSAALIRTTGKLLLPLDRNNDKKLSLSELETDAKIPATLEDGVQQGINWVQGEEHRIRPFDANEDRKLDVSERKALTMAYMTAAMRYVEDAQFYAQLAEALTVRRDGLAQKYREVALSAEATEPTGE